MRSDSDPSGARKIGLLHAKGGRVCVLRIFFVGGGPRATRGRVQGSKVRCFGLGCSKVCGMIGLTCRFGGVREVCDYECEVGRATAGVLGSFGPVVRIDRPFFLRGFMYKCDKIIFGQSNPIQSDIFSNRFPFK